MLQRAYTGNLEGTLANNGWGLLLQNEGLPLRSQYAVRW